MGYNNFLYQEEGHIAVLTLNRPQRLNAISLDQVREMRELVDAIQGKDSPRAVIITGAPRPDGRPCFSAGADLKDELAPYTRTMEFNDLLNKIEDSRRVWIAAIDGVCTAGGLELALACDLRVASETAEVSDLHLKNLGTLGGGGVTARLPRVIGMAKAKEMVLTGDAIDGREAWRLNLANRVFPPDRMLEGAKALARRIAEMDPHGVAIIKLHMDLGATMPMHDSVHLALRLRHTGLGIGKASHESPEAEEAARRAALEKQRPTAGA